MYTEKSMVGLFILFFILMIISSVKMTTDYKKKGRLTLPGSVILLVWFCVHGLIMDYATCNSIYEHADNFLLRTMGILLIVTGLVIMAIAMINFGTFTRTMVVNTNELITTGLYRYTRNPQYVGYGITVIGFNVAWFTPISVVSMITYLIMIYITIVIEEKNLKRIYGEDFTSFCNTTPRFIGL